MGIIQRQAISGTAITYIGVVVGFVTTALIFPRVLTTDQIGLLGIFVSYSYVFAQLGTLGTSRITIVFFPYFKDRSKNHNSFFFLMAIISMIGLLLAIGGFFLIKPWLVENARDSSNLLAENINWLLPLIIVTLAFLVLDSMYKNLFNAVQGILLKEFVQRAFILFFILFFIQKWITFEQYVPLYVLSIAIAPVVLLFNLSRHKEFTFSPSTFTLARQFRTRMASVGFYGILIGFSGMIILNIDRIMVERMLGLSMTGIYTTMAYFATLIVIPSRALLKISDPVIADSWKNSDLDKLSDNYYRSSLNQFLAGSLVFIGIWGNIDNILRILPAEFAPGYWVVFFVGLAFLADMATGTATPILANSRYYKYQTYFVVLLVVFIVISNYFFIPLWGITGAAFATFISKFLNNIMRHQMLYRKLQLQPYNIKFVWIILIAGISYFAGYVIPEITNLLLDIFIRSLAILLVFSILIIYFKVSGDLNEKYTWLKDKIFRK